MESRSLEVDEAAGGTCRWLLDDETYKSWATQNPDLLWINGKPGSGKSTLLKYALEHQGDVTTTKDSDLVMCFFFHGRGNEFQRSPLGFFRSLLHQVLSHAPASSDLVDEFKRKCATIGEPGDKWQWHENELRSSFEASFLQITKDRPIWLFVDALDECGEDNAVKLFGWFQSLLKKVPSAPIRPRICVSCRHYPILDPNCKISICPEDKNSQDISIYVQSRLDNSPALAKVPIPELTNLSTLIAKRASGVFMWARLVIDRVSDAYRKGKRQKEIGEMIKSTPPELSTLYQGLVNDMAKNPESLQLIQWICFATRPMSLDELNWALAIKPECPLQSLREYESECDGAQGAEMMIRRVKTLSRGLAEVTNPTEFETTSPSRHETVQFIHQSVKDFFVENGLLCLHKTPPTVNTTISAHFQLASTCIRYLGAEEIRAVYESTTSKVGVHGSNILTKFPFIQYATLSWVEHMTLSDDFALQDHFLELLAWPSNDLMNVWLHVYRQIDRYDSPCERTSLIHIAARHSNMKMLQNILGRAQKRNEDNLYIEAQDDYGQTPLSQAAEMGHQAVVELLLQRGAQIEARNEYGQTPLSWAARMGHRAVVELLLQRGAQIEAQDSTWGQTPLSWAAEMGHRAVVELLLQRGAQPP